MTLTYCMRKDTVQDEDGREHTVYGIEAIADGGETLASYPDVFFNKDKAEHLIGLCNKGGLSLVHLRDIIDDALVG